VCGDSYHPPTSTTTSQSVTRHPHRYISIVTLHFLLPLLFLLSGPRTVHWLSSLPLPRTSLSLSLSLDLSLSPSLRLDTRPLFFFFTSLHFSSLRFAFFPVILSHQKGSPPFASSALRRLPSRHGPIVTPSTSAAPPGPPNSRVRVAAVSFSLWLSRLSPPPSRHDDRRVARIACLVYNSSSTAPLHKSGVITCCAS